MATKQQYATCPAEVETYRLGEQTDVILRKTIREIEKTEERDGEEVTYTVYECEERQFRYPGKLTQAEVEKDFDTWWEWEPEEETDKDGQSEADQIAALTEKVTTLEGQLEDTQLALCDVYEQVLAATTTEEA